jgi:hypothetical protein
MYVAMAQLVSVTAPWNIVSAACIRTHVLKSWMRKDSAKGSLSISYHLWNMQRCAPTFAMDNGPVQGPFSPSTVLYHYMGHGCINAFHFSGSPMQLLRTLTTSFHKGGLLRRIPFEAHQIGRRYCGKRVHLCILFNRARKIWNPDGSRVEDIYISTKFIHYLIQEATNSPQHIIAARDSWDESVLMFLFPGSTKTCRKIRQRL